MGGHCDNVFSISEIGTSAGLIWLRRESLGVLVNAVLSFRVSQNVGDLLAS